MECLNKNHINRSNTTMIYKILVFRISGGEFECKIIWKIEKENNVEELCYLFYLLMSLSAFRALPAAGWKTCEDWIKTLIFLLFIKNDRLIIFSPYRSDLRSNDKITKKSRGTLTLVGLSLFMSAGRPNLLANSR